MAQINPEKLSQMLGMLSGKTGVDGEKIQSAVRSGSMDDILKNLKPADAQKLQRVLSDKASAERLLKTEQAQQLLKKLLEGK